MKGVFKIKRFDLAIIGAGPVGLFAADFANLHNLHTIVFDSLAETGGQPQMLYPLKKISDIPAYDVITGTNLIQKLRNNVGNNTTIANNHKVVSIQKTDAGFIIDDDFQVRSIIIATGAGAFKPKELPLKTTDAIQKRIHYYIKDPQDFSNQTIGVFGGGDSALDFALELANHSRVKLIHRREQFRGLESSINKLRNLDNVELLTPYLPKSIELIDDKLNITLKQTGSQKVITEQFDQIVVAYGFKANNLFIKKWGIETNNRHIAVDSTMKTNIDGIYAIGDAITYPGRIPLIALGFGEAQIAISTIMRNLFPEKTLTIHSTSL